MSGIFELYTDNDGEYRFRLKASNGENILISQGYKRKITAENGIESAKRNASEDARYERKETVSGAHIFNLKAKNGQVIGTSPLYASASGRDGGIESVKSNAPDALVVMVPDDLIQNFEIIRDHIQNSTDSRSQRRIAQAKSVADSLPDQSDIVKFGLSKQAKVELVAVPSAADDVDRILAIRSELISEDGPIAVLNRRYSGNPNAPQSALLEKFVSRYAKELRKDLEDINYAVLFARGTRLLSASKTAEHNIQTGEWPDFEPEEQEALDSLIALHGALIMSTPVGRGLVASSDEFEGTPDTRNQEQELFEELAEMVSEETEIFEAETVEAIQDITTLIEIDPHPTRIRTLRRLLAGSLLVSVVGATAWIASLGPSLALLPAAAGGMFIWEAVKKTDDFKSATDFLAKGYDVMPEQAAEQLKNLKRMSKMLRKRRVLFTKLADLRPEFGWAKRYLKTDDTFGDEN